MKKLMTGLVMVTALTAFAPQPVAAQNCAQEYAQCLSDNWYQTGLFQVLSDVECGADYIACVRNKFRS